MAQHIFRVVVRGQFADLTDGLRAELSARADEHDITRSSYTKEGTFTYDAPLVSFSFRFEVRESSDGDLAPAECEANALARAETLAVAYLDGRGIASKRLRSNAVNMADMWR